MEFKDNLKKLRKDKGITQQELADTIFVSRSAIAKWENGLGLPGEESIQALQRFFGVSLSELATSEPETVIVEKNIKLKKLLTVCASVLAALLVIFSLTLPYLLISGNYGLTPSSVAGGFANNAYIDTGDYRFYFSSFEGELENGQHWSSLSAFKPVKKHFWGCTVSERDYESNLILHNYQVAGKLYSIKGKHGYYNLIMSNFGNKVHINMITLTELRVSGEIYFVEKGFFFITPEPVECFWVADAFMTVE